MFGKGGNWPTAGNIPPYTGGIPGGRQYFRFVQKSTAGNESVMIDHLHGLVGGIPWIYGTQVIQSTTRH